MTKIKDLKIKVFFDGARIEDFKSFAHFEYIKGFTTNLSLMRKAGVVDYEKFIQEILSLAKDRPISFEVTSDDFGKMHRQAIKLGSFGKNVYVKIPIMNTKGLSSISLIDDLLCSDIKINITAIMTIKQIEELTKIKFGKTPVILSVFAGRIADTGIDPVSIIKQARQILKGLKNVELLWASPREILNIFQAEESGCDIITLIPEILKKLHLIGYDLHSFSLDTIKMFYNDGISSGLKI